MAESDGRFYLCKIIIIIMIIIISLVQNYNNNYNNNDNNYSGENSTDPTDIQICVATSIFITWSVKKC